MSYDFRARSDAALIFNNEPSRTKQDFKASCDMNNILKKYTRNGISPFVITSNAKFGDFASLPSYEEAVQIVAEADQKFDMLPAQLRARFSNNPAELLSFLQNESNRDEAIKLGLALPQVQSEDKIVPDAIKAPSSKGDS